MSSLFVILRSDNGNLLGILVVIVVVFVSLYFTRKATVMRGLRRKGIKKIKDFSDGDTGRIVGKVVFAGETLYAPLSKRECVYYNVFVEHYSRRGKYMNWHKIIEEEAKADIVISDGTGYAIIDANEAMSYLIQDANYSSDSGWESRKEFMDLLARHDVDSKGFFGKKTLRYSEGILAKGEKFAVSGEGQWNETKDHKLNLPSSKVLVIVPAPHEKVFISDDPDATRETDSSQLSV